ncbi:MAG: TetR/AcrR family transcriptional regulator [Candidatus Fermentibacteraceae bacterium]|nr:TetR/AcrR family transcriptional regulator [Candidatus Fermentibacteraceae bacterium]MBN2608604.1 TetR/AcrR family transcriptional regulator [Candidatus Fermentibacteraceae bacterium]
MEKDGDTKRNILKTAEMLIGNESVCSITTRRIAEEADVNPAALNYHFGSKEELIDLVLSRMMDRVFNDWQRILEIQDMALPVRLYCLIDHSMESIIKYPGMLSSHLFDPMVSKEKRIAFAGRLGGFLRSLPVHLEEELPLQADEIRLNLGQVILSSICAAAVPELFREIAQEDISSGPARSRFITGLMRRFLRIDIKASEIIQSDIARVRKLAFTEREMER